MKSGRWTKAEEGALRDLYPDHTARHIAALLLRRPQDVKHRAWRLGLSKAAGKAQATASLTLREEIAAAKAEWATAPLYRPGGRDG